MRQNRYTFGLFVKIAIGITIVCVIFGIIAYRIDCNIDFNEMFTALTAWFSGLAFAGIIFTILQQKEELELQRDELSLTRGELKIQNETLKKQRFENTFFNLLSQHNKIIEGLYFSDKKADEVKNDFSFDAFRYAHILLKEQSLRLLKEFLISNNRSINSDFNSLSENEREALLDKLTAKWYNKNPHNLHLYFQSLKRILKFIHRSTLLDSTEEKQFYASFLRDQINYYEMAVILYTGLLANDLYKGITYYIKEYKILEHIDEKSLITINDKQHFDKWARQAEPID